MLLQGFKTLNMPVWVDGLYMWYNVYQNHPFFIQENIVYDLHAEGVALYFFF